jgi:hypothetical protein
MSVVHLGIFVLAAFVAFVFFSRYKREQAEEEGREDLRTLTLRSRRSPTEARFRIRRYAEETRGVVLRDGTGDPMVLTSTPGPLQPGYFFRIRIRKDDEGCRLDVGVRSRMALHFWHPFVDGKVDEVAEGLLEALDPALRVDG